MYAYLGRPGPSVPCIYVCNLHPEVHETTLYEKFSRAGRVVSIKVFRDEVTRRSLGYAYVNFQQPAEAVRALDTMNFDIIRDRPCRITWHDPSILHCSGIGKIFIKHLDKDIDNKTLFDAFSTFGNILLCEVAQNEMGESKGYGFVHFETQEAADTAIKKVHGMLLNGKKVVVEKFKPHNKQTRMVSTSKPRDRQKEERSAPLCFQQDYPSNPYFPAPLQPPPPTLQSSMVYCGAVVPMGWTQAQRPYFPLMQYPDTYQWTPPPMMGGAMQSYGQSYYSSGGRGSSMPYDVMPSRDRPQQLSACDVPSPLYLTPPTMQGATPTMSGPPPTMPGAPPTFPGPPPTFPGPPPTMSGPPPTMPGAPPTMPGAPPTMPGAPPTMPGAPPTFPGAPPTMSGAPPIRVKYTGVRNRSAPQIKRSQIPPVDLPGSAVMQGITLSDLAAMPAQEQKQFLGENLYTRIISIDPLFQDMDLAGKITGMLLEMDNTDLLHLLESQDALREKVQEAIAVLEAHRLEETIAVRVNRRERPPRSVRHTAAARNHTAMQAAGSQIPPVDLPGSTVMQGITLSDLAAMPAQEQKQLLGEHLYTRIRNIDPLSQDADLAWKITGMLLEMDNADLLHLLESQDALREKAQEAIDVLGAHEQQKSAAMATTSNTVKYSAVVRNHPALQACKQKESSKGEQSTAMPGYPQDYADLAFHFVEKPPEWLICAVCQELALDPVQAICCGKMYCANCIESWKTKSNSCPTCRRTPSNVFQDRNAHQRIASLAVYCPNQCNGCSKTVELSELEKHLTSDNGCLFHVVECSNKCGHSAWRSHISKHMANECPLRSEQSLSLVPTHDVITGANLGERPESSLEQEVRLQEQGSPQEQEVIPQEQEVSRQEGNIQEQEVGFQEQEVIPHTNMDDLSGKLENIAL